MKQKLDLTLLSDTDTACPFLSIRGYNTMKIGQDFLDIQYPVNRNTIISYSNLVWYKPIKLTFQLGFSDNLFATTDPADPAPEKCVKINLTI